MKRTLDPSIFGNFSSESARLCVRIKKFIEEQVGTEPIGKVVVGCSGGVDSLALSIVLKWLGIPIVLAHLDHQLRQESVCDAQHVLSFSEKLDVACVIKAIDVRAYSLKYHVGIEEAGRIVRYNFLEQVRKEHHAQWIAVGHHLDDLCEDVLLRLIRGTGWPGLAGMKALDRKRSLLRPLLNTRRTDLERFLVERGVVWAEDISNQEMVFKRNRIRHRVLPLFKEENPNFVQSVQRLWLLAKEDEAFWNKLLEDILLPAQYTGTSYWIPRDVVTAQSRAVRLRIYFFAIQKLCAGHGRSDTFFLLDTAIMKGRKEKCFQFSNGVTATLDTSGVLFSKENIL